MSKELSIALDVITFLFRAIPELVDLVSRWLDGDPGSDDDPIYQEVKAKLDAALTRLDDEIDSVEKLKN